MRRTQSLRWMWKLSFKLFWKKARAWRNCPKTHRFRVDFRSRSHGKAMRIHIKFNVILLFSLIFYLSKWFIFEEFEYGIDFNIVKIDYYNVIFDLVITWFIVVMITPVIKIVLIYTERNLSDSLYYYRKFSQPKNM